MIPRTLSWGVGMITIITLYIYPPVNRKYILSMRKERLRVGNTVLGVSSKALFLMIMKLE